MATSKELGKVKSARIELEDHDILTFGIGIDFGGSYQVFGGYPLDEYSADAGHRIGCAAGTDMILRLLRLFKARHLQEVVGRPVFALRDGSNPCVIFGLEVPAFDGGGSLLISDWQERWFPAGRTD